MEQYRNAGHDRFLKTHANLCAYLKSYLEWRYMTYAGDRASLKTQGIKLKSLDYRKSQCDVYHTFIIGRPRVRISTFIARPS
jgi:hypothetical protein